MAHFFTSSRFHHFHNFAPLRIQNFNIFRWLFRKISTKFAKFWKIRNILTKVNEISWNFLPLFKKDLKDFFGPKKILFFRLKYLKVRKKILGFLAGFSVKCVKPGKKILFSWRNLARLKYIKSQKKIFFQNFRAQREKFFNIYVIFLMIS